MLQWRGGPANDCYHWAGSGRRNLYVKRDMGTIHSLGIGKDDKKKLCQRGPHVAAGNKDASGRKNLITGKTLMNINEVNLIKIFQWF